MTRRWPSNRHLMHRLGIFALAVLFVLQAIVVASAPRVALAADNETVVVCSGTGMKVVSLSGLGVDSLDDLDPDDTSHLASGDHCALCALGHPVPLPSSLSFFFTTEPGLPSAQAPTGPGPFDTGLYSPLQARAPPIFNA